jgi:hypothetical protein
VKEAGKAKLERGFGRLGRSCFLGSSTTAATHGAAATAWLETATRLTADATTATVRSAAWVEWLLRAGAALLNLDLDAVDSMWIGVDGTLVAGGGLEINESAILWKQLAGTSECLNTTYLGAADIEVFNLAKLRKYAPQSAFLHLAVDILDIGTLLLCIGRSLVLDAGLLLLGTSGLPARSIALAVGGGRLTSRSGVLGGHGQRLA